MADGDPIDPPEGGEPPGVVTGSGDGSTKRFSIGDLDYRDVRDLKVLVKESGSWVFKTRGTHYVVDQIEKEIVFNSGQEPASGTNNVEVWVQTPRDLSEYGTEDERHPPAYIVKELEGQILPYPWAFNSVGSNAATSAHFRLGQTNLSACPFPVPFDVTCKQVAVCTTHEDSSSPPESWTVSIYVNGSGSPKATFVAALAAASSTPKVTVGSWSSTFDLDAGDYFRLAWAGSAVDFPLASLLMLYRLRTPRL